MLPLVAAAAARLRATVVFPSSGVADVSSTVFTGASTLKYRRFALSMEKAEVFSATHELVLRLLREGHGAAGDAEDEEILETQRTLARTEGIWAGPTGVATLAVLGKMLAANELDPTQSYCAIVSETGLKTEAAPPSRSATAFDYDSLARLVRERLARA